MQASFKGVIIIPARLQSQRLPNKMLAPINGQPMIWHVWQRAQASARELGARVVVAAAEAEVVELVRAFGGEAVLTSPALNSGSDRVYAALAQLPERAQYDYVCNLQGDMPNVGPEVITQTISALSTAPEFEVMTAVGALAPEAVNNPNIVKAVLESRGEATHLPSNVYSALYFSRGPVPYQAQQYWEHIGVYVYRPKALEQFVNLPISTIEQTERLEQLRGLAHGIRYGAIVVDRVPISVDTSEDLQHARAIMTSSNE